MKQIIVSGAAGFIGSEFCRMLQETDTVIHMVDPLVTGSDTLRAIPASRRHIRYFGQTLFNACESIDLEQIDTVFMFGALSSVDYCNDNPSQAFYYNVSDVFNFLQLLHVMKHEGLKVPKLVYVSTDEVGGQLEYDGKPWHPEGQPETVATQPIPHSPRNTYSGSKAAAEMIVKGMCTQYGIEFVITRAVNNYGHNQGGGKLIPNIIDAINSDTPIPIRGNSVEDVNSHYRCWVAVEDHCKAVLDASTKPSGYIYHVPGQKLKNIQVIKMISRQLGKPFKLGLKPAREAHDMGYQLKGDKSFEARFTLGTYFRGK